MSTQYEIRARLSAIQAGPPKIPVTRLAKEIGVKARSLNNFLNGRTRPSDVTTYFTNLEDENLFKVKTYLGIPTGNTVLAGLRNLVTTHENAERDRFIEAVQWDDYSVVDVSPDAIHSDNGRGATMTFRPRGGVTVADYEALQSSLDIPEVREQFCRVLEIEDDGV